MKDNWGLTKEMITDFYKKIEDLLVNMDKTHLIFLSGIKGFSESKYKNWIIEKYPTSFALIDDNFLVKKIYNGTANKTSDLREMIINEIKDKKIIYLDRTCEFNDDLLEPLLSIINYCIHYEKKIFIISGLKFPRENSYEKYNIWHNTLMKKVSGNQYDIIQVEQLSRDEMRTYLQQLNVGIQIKNIEYIIDYSFNNSIALELLVSALKEYSACEQEIILSEETIIGALEDFYKAIIDSLDQNLKQILQYAAAIGYEIYVSFMDVFNVKNSKQKLNEIKNQTKIIHTSKDIDEFDFIFNDNIVFNITLKQISSDNLKNYSLNLSKKVRELLNNNESISRIKLLELLIQYQKFSENEIYKHNAIKELLKEYCKKGLYDTCLNYINKNTSESLEGINEVKLECIYNLNKFTDCVNIINSKKKKTNNEIYILAASYYRLGFPEKTIKTLKSLSNKEQTDNKVVFLLMASSYEWLCDKKNYVKFYDLALKNLSRDKPRDYYSLLRKCNMVIDPSLPAFENYFSEAMKYFKQNNLSKELAWVYHNYATSKLLALDDMEKSLDLLNKSLKLLGSIYEIDIIDVKNSIGMYYAFKFDWENAKRQFISSYNKYEILFCDIANKLNLATMYRKLNNFVKFENLLNEVEQLILKNKYDKSILLQKQVYFYNKGLLHKLKNDYNQALIYYEKALKILPKEYGSYYYLSIANDILNISKNMDVDNKLYKLAKKYSFTSDKLSNFYSKNGFILSEIMFWN